MRNPRFDDERANVHKTLLDLKRDLDPLLKRNKIRLKGSVSDYWIIPKRRPEIGCLWLRYPQPKNDYTIPHLEVTVYDDEVFIGLAIPKKGRRYQENLLRHMKRKGLELVGKFSRLPSHAANFVISGDKVFFEGSAEDVTVRHALDMVQSYAPGADYVDIGYTFKKSDPRVGTRKLLGLATKIFSELYWVYKIARMKAMSAPTRPAETGLGDRSTLRPFDKKRAERYAGQIESYEVDSRKKEKASRYHRKITYLLADALQIQGFECQYDPRSIDLVCRGNNGISYLFEVKSCNQRNLWRQARSGISQLYEYRYFVLNRKSRTRLFLAIQTKPSADLCKYLENDRGIGVLWLEKGSLKTTEKTRAWLSPIRVD